MKSKGDSALFTLTLGVAAGFAFAIGCGTDEANAEDTEELLDRIEALENRITELETQVGEQKSAGIDVIRIQGPTESVQTSSALCPADTWLVGGGCDCSSGGTAEFSSPRCINQAGCTAEQDGWAAQAGFSCEDCDYAQWDCACASGDQTAYALCATPYLGAGE